MTDQPLDPIDLQYLSRMAEALAEGRPMQLVEGMDKTYILSIETDEELLVLEVLKENRFGRRLDS